MTFFLGPIQRDGFQNQRITPHLGDVVLQHLQAPDVVIGFGKQAHPALHIDGAHALELSPQADAFFGRFGRDFVGE